MDELGAAERSMLFERYGRTFEAGATIYSEGDRSEFAFLLQEGRIRLVRRVRSTQRALTVLSTGDLFGEEALVPRAVRAATAEAVTDVTTLALDSATFGHLLASNATVAVRLIGQLVHRLRDAEEQLENAMLPDHPSRIVNTLLRRAQGQEASEAGHEVRLSPLELASRVGLDVDTVKSSVQQLRDGGYLRIVDERILLPDLSALRKLYVLLGRKEEVRDG
ncbi:MAG: Crp/Fnr family transcriptional regulator [Myxococcales bacterium]|nr:Crp/Fnr family transcriptional regulator [Myxococcales bacterium]